MSDCSSEQEVTDSEYPPGTLAYRLHTEGHHLVTGDNIGPNLATIVWAAEKPMIRLIGWLVEKLDNYHSDSTEGETNGS